MSRFNFELQNFQLSSSMATFTFSFFLFLSLSLFLVSAHTSPYLSPLTFSQNYQKMLTSFRIFIYTPLQPITFSTPSASIFYNFLVNSPFLTQDPNQAHLFFVPFSPDTSTRSLARLVRELRTKYPHWNRTLGADHFFISPTGIDFSSDRNVLELKKNSVQISVFPTISGNFIPHKDITLPPANPSSLALSHAPVNEALSFLCYLKWDGKTESNLVNELRLDPEFVIESEPSDHHVGRVRSSKFCLFFYDADVAWMAEAMAAGCVPVVIVDRPVQDFPLTDVLRWSEMALLVGNRRGAEGLKAVLRGVPEDRYGRMREFSVAATHHMVWSVEPQPHDAFHMVMYQLWMRRHTIRYARREDV